MKRCKQLQPKQVSLICMFLFGLVSLLLGVVYQEVRQVNFGTMPKGKSKIQARMHQEFSLVIWTRLEWK